MRKSKKDKMADDAVRTHGKVDKKTAKIVEELEQKVEALTQENQELLDKFQRLQADYANHQKRTPKQIADSVAYEKRAILLSLLPSLDNFSHALAGAETAKKGQGGLEGVVEGVSLVFQHLLDGLKAHGVQKVEAVGRPFDPSVHEAMMRRCEPDKEDGVVLEEFQAGYTLNGQVLRPSKVVVNKLTTAPAEQDQARVDEQLADEEGED